MTALTVRLLCTLFSSCTFKVLEMQSHLELRPCRCFSAAAYCQRGQSRLCNYHQRDFWHVTLWEVCDPFVIVIHSGAQCIFFTYYTITLKMWLQVLKLIVHSSFLKIKQKSEDPVTLVKQSRLMSLIMSLQLRNHHNSPHLSINSRISHRLQ